MLKQMKLFSLKITVLIFFSSFFVIAQPILVSTIDEFNLAILLELKQVLEDAIDAKE